MLDQVCALGRGSRGGRGVERRRRTRGRSTAPERHHRSPRCPATCVPAARLPRAAPCCRRRASCSATAWTRLTCASAAPSPPPWWSAWASRRARGPSDPRWVLAVGGAGCGRLPPSAAAAGRAGGAVLGAGGAGGPAVWAAATLPTATSARSTHPRPAFPPGGGARAGGGGAVHRGGGRRGRRRARRRRRGRGGRLVRRRAAVVRGPAAPSCSPRQSHGRHAQPAGGSSATSVTATDHQCT